MRYVGCDFFIEKLHICSVLRFLFENCEYLEIQQLLKLASTNFLRLMCVMSFNQLGMVSTLNKVLREFYLTFFSIYILVHINPTIKFKLCNLTL